MIDQFDFDYLMLPYNFHHNSAGASGKGTSYEKLMRVIKEKNIGLLAMKPMGSNQMVKLARENNFFGKDHKGPSIPMAMLRYIYENPNITCAIPAMNSMEELKENLASIEHHGLSDEEWNELVKLSRFAFETKGAYLTPQYKWLERWAV